MDNVEQTRSLIGVLSTATLIDAVVVTLCVGISTWVLNEYAWTTLVHPLKSMFVDGNLLFYGAIATVFLIIKEYCGISKSLTLTVNALALVVSLGYLALYMYVNVAALSLCSDGLAMMD